MNWCRFIFPLVALFGAVCAGAEPVEFRAVYRADYKGLPVSATGVRELSRNENGTYTFTSSAKSFFASVTEQSEFEWTDEYRPLSYRYIRKGIGNNRDDSILFDWNRKTANHGEIVYDIPMGTLDKLLYQLQMRHDLRHASAQDNEWPAMHYDIADRRRLRSFDFEVVGNEQIDTPLGRFDTVKAIRIREDKSRKTTLWMSPDYNFLLVRLKQQEDENDGFELLLKEAIFDGATVRGL